MGLEVRLHDECHRQPGRLNQLGVCNHRLMQRLPSRLEETVELAAQRQ